MFSIEWWNGKHGSHLNTVVHYTQHIIGQSIFKIGSFCSPFSLIQNLSIQCKELIHIMITADAFCLNFEHKLYDPSLSAFVGDGAGVFPLIALPS